MKNCTSCEAPLFTAVAYCPFCGAASGMAKPSAATAANAAAVAVPLAAAAPTVAPVAPAPTPAAVPPVSAPTPAPIPAPARAPVSAPAAAAAAPVATPTPAARPSPLPAATTAVTPRPPQRSWGKILLGIVLVLGGLAYLGRKPAQDDSACTAAFDQGTKLIASGDLAGARMQSLQANALCTGSAKAKSETLQAALADADKAGNACSRGLNAIGSQLEDRQLNQARSNLDQLDSSCSATPAAGKLRQRLSQAQNEANGALQATRQALAGNDAAKASAALERLMALNSEAADVPHLSAELAKLQSEVNAAEQPVATPVAAMPQPTPVTAPAIAMPKMPDVHAPKIDPAASAKAEMAQSFLRDAETALSQRKFDAARTYLDSARRMDPGNPRLDSLAQQIRERERQMMQQETTIR